MTKEEQINEMANYYCGYCKEHTGKKFCRLFYEQDCSIFSEAELFYNAGYRKIPEGSLVMTKEELVKTMESGYVYDTTRGNKINIIEMAREVERKETAKKILIAMRTMIINRRADERSGLNCIYSEYKPERLLDDISDYVKVVLGVEVKE